MIGLGRKREHSRGARRSNLQVASPRVVAVVPVGARHRVRAH
jgi:hypothetical protein